MAAKWIETWLTNKLKPRLRLWRDICWKKGWRKEIGASTNLAWPHLMCKEICENSDKKLWLLHFVIRAILVYPPSVDYMVAFLACLKAGVVAVPAFPPNPARKDTLLMFSRITESCGATVALTSSDYNHMKKLAGVKDVFTKFTASRHAQASWPEQLEWIVTDNKKQSSNAAKLPTPSPSDLAFLQYTSGKRFIDRLFHCYSHGG